MRRTMGRTMRREMRRAMKRAMRRAMSRAALRRRIECRPDRGAIGRRRLDFAAAPLTAWRHGAVRRPSSGWFATDVHFTRPPMPPLSRVLTVALVLSSLAACGGNAGEAADSTSATPSAAAPAASAPATPPAGPDPRVTAADAARIKGDVNAKLWIVVVSDFQCPFCAQWERETAAQVIEEFVNPGIARLAFVNYPLQQHANALPAAEAAMCAGAQGKFWAMHDRIFATQNQWSLLPSSAAFFESAALEIGVSAPEYTACISEHVMRPMIEADVERATAGGARSTPTFFIGNQVISGAEKIEAFRAAIAQARSALP